MKEESITIQGAVGKLKGIVTTPTHCKEKETPTVIIFHGLTRNKDVVFHKILAESLANYGIASVRFDFNGHGKSEGMLKDMTIDNELEDARRIYAFTKTLPFVGAIGVVGHSQGGVVSILLGAELGEKNIKAMTLLAPGVGIHDSMVQGTFFGASFDPINVPDEIVLNNNIVLGKEYVLSGQRMKPFEAAKKEKEKASKKAATTTTSGVKKKANGKVFWEQAFERKVPDNITIGIGYYDGVAGIAASLLQLDSLLKGNFQAVRFVDDPFPESLVD